MSFSVFFQCYVHNAFTKLLNTTLKRMICQYFIFYLYKILSHFIWNRLFVGNYVLSSSWWGSLVDLNYENCLFASKHVTPGTVWGQVHGGEEE